MFCLEDKVRFLIHLLEHGFRTADEGGTGQICVIYDRANMSNANKDDQLVNTVKSFSGILQDYYAERLGAVYVLHVNWLYYIMFQAVKSFLKRTTRDKIFIIRNVNVLRTYFDEGQLMREYGGTNGYVHCYPKE